MIIITSSTPQWITCETMTVDEGDGCGPGEFEEMMWPPAHGAVDQGSVEMDEWAHLG